MEIAPQNRTPLTKSLIHLPLLVVSVIIALAIGYSDLVSKLIPYGEIGFTLAALVFGIMYSSVFTVAPATVGFVKLAELGVSPILLALVGGLGAMIGDLSMFQIIKFSMLDDIVRYMQRRTRGKFESVFRVPIVRYALIILGALIVASPIPDEVGLAMMGIAHARWPFVATVGFILNAVGIFAIALLAR